MKKQNDSAFPEWLKYLLDVVRPHWWDNKRDTMALGDETAKALAVLDTFHNYDDDKMMAAVKEYLKTKRDAYIPFPGDLSDCFPQVDTVPTRKSRAFHIWHRDEVAVNWAMCQDCGERTPNVTACPFCADMKTRVIV